MLDCDYAIGVFERHFSHVRLELPASFTVLELGPGDSLATALIASGRGASKTWLVDRGAFASLEAEAYSELWARLGTRLPPGSYDSIASMLDMVRGVYLVEGLESLRAIPDRSIDFCFSHAVLEHIALNEFADTVRELYRIQMPGGLSSHRVDLQDHLAHSLNSLRFSSSVWESTWIARSGFYTNRLRAPEIVEFFKGAGYEVSYRSEDHWPTLPLAEGRLAPNFAHFSDEELRVRALDLVVRKSPAG